MRNIKGIRETKDIHRLIKKKEEIIKLDEAKEELTEQKEIQEDIQSNEVKENNELKETANEPKDNGFKLVRRTARKAKRSNMLFACCI